MANGDDDEDLQIRVDFRGPETARTWVEETRRCSSARTVLAPGSVLLYVDAT